MNKMTEPIRHGITIYYYNDSKGMGKSYARSGGYWDRNVELIARAFATYIMDKLENQSDYLVGHAESAGGWGADKDGNKSLSTRRGTQSNKCCI